MKFYWFGDSFFSEHDRRRGTDFLQTFPEMRAWWAECEYHARS